MRDWTGIFYEQSVSSNGVCKICSQPRTPEGIENHAKKHLADGTATVEISMASAGRLERVIPTADVPWNPKDGPAPDARTALPIIGQRKLDSKLAKIVALAQAKDKQARKGTP